MDPGQKIELIAILSAHDQLMFKDFIISISPWQANRHAIVFCKIYYLCAVAWLSTKMYLTRDKYLRVMYNFWI